MTALTEKAREIAAKTPEPVRGLAALRLPFGAEHIGKLPRAGIELDYVGHGAVTHRLLEVDPAWTWEPMATDASGAPLFTLDANGNPIAFWIRLTVLGVTRPGVGTCKGNQFDAEKVLIGDALRNAAMRFGVALDLWIRGHAEDDEKVSAENAGPPPVRTTATKPSVRAIAKNRVLELAKNDESLAKDAWGFIETLVSEPWPLPAVEAAFLTFMAPPDGEAA